MLLKIFKNSLKHYILHIKKTVKVYPENVLERLMYSPFLFKTVYYSHSFVNKKDLLERAVTNGNLEIVKFLVANGAGPGGCDIRSAVHNGNLEIVKVLVASGANFTEMDNYAVRFASWNGYLEIVKFLVASGADLTACNNDAIRSASRCGHFEVVKFLIEHGATFD